MERPVTPQVVGSSSQEARMNASAHPFNPTHQEEHYVNRNGWLRAAVLGANDGLLSTSSLMVGVAAASASTGQLMLTGVAGIAAGAMSMAAGEFVSVSSQSDTEKADIEREKQGLSGSPEEEKRELAGLYIRRGLSRAVSYHVASYPAAAK
jgi:VIT1/CCC1 family predicted Fe2+/Mn2+ transporter